jgi:hypothetical protein
MSAAEGVEGAVTVESAESTVRRTSRDHWGSCAKRPEILCPSVKQGQVILGD